MAMVGNYLKPSPPPPWQDVFYTFPKPPHTHFSSDFKCESCPNIRYCLYPGHIENAFSDFISKHFVTKTEFLQSLVELL